ncbi:hypothetical protein ACH429_25670 [Streptomyces pathocidini]|uniref:Uncharacterized protein n=1 Tax=Streptomyces pathocidini TaxID=1650571 RepID=A0ABW7V0J1_9ACTN|nr:hypothetical protein [Streptomyces pathocidini]
MGKRSEASRLISRYLSIQELNTDFSNVNTALVSVENRCRPDAEALRAVQELQSSGKLREKFRYLVLEELQKAKASSVGSGGGTSLDRFSSFLDENGYGTSVAQFATALGNSLEPNISRWAEVYGNTTYRKDGSLPASEGQIIVYRDSLIIDDEKIIDFDFNGSSASVVWDSSSGLNETSGRLFFSHPYVAGGGLPCICGHIVFPEGPDYPLGGGEVTVSAIPGGVEDYPPFIDVQELHSSLNVIGMLVKLARMGVIVNYCVNLNG